MSSFSSLRPGQGREGYVEEVAFIFFSLAVLGIQRRTSNKDGQVPTTEPHSLPRRWVSFLLGNLWVILGVWRDWRGMAFPGSSDWE